MIVNYLQNSSKIKNKQKYERPVAYKRKTKL